MKRIALGFLIGSLVLSGTALAVDAHRWHHHGDGSGHPWAGFLAGAIADLVLEAFRIPPVAREPRYYYKGMICQDVQVPGQWELERRQDDGSYPIWRPGYWRRECY